MTLQMVFISVGASRQQKKRDSLDIPSVLPPPPRESLPTLLLLQPQYFEQLFSLMQTLSSMKTSVKGGVSFLLIVRRKELVVSLLPSPNSNLFFILTFLGYKLVHLLCFFPWLLNLWTFQEECIGNVQHFTPRTHYRSSLWLSNRCTVNCDFAMQDCAMS